MTKALVDLPHEAIEQLDLIAKKRQVSRAALVRTAIAVWLKEQRPSDSRSAFGILKNHQTIDGVDFQSKIRNEW